MGGSHLRTIKNLTKKNNLQPIAVADCWKTRAEQGAKTVGAGKSFTDYRQVLDIKEIDYVTIATDLNYDTSGTGTETWHRTGDVCTTTFYSDGVCERDCSGDCYTEP